MPRGASVLIAWRLLAGPPGARRGPRLRRVAGMVAGVALSLVPLVLVQQVADAMIRGIAERFIEADTGHIRAVARRVRSEEELTAAAQSVAAIPGVVSVMRERRGFALVYSATGRSGVQVRGLDGEVLIADAAIRRLVNVVDGTLASGGDGILLGAATADELSVGPGDTVRMLTLLPRGDGGALPRVSSFVVTGVISTGYQELDRSWAVIGWERALRVVPDEAATDLLAIKMADPFALATPLTQRGIGGAADRTAATDAVRLQSTVTSALGGGWQVDNWYEAERGRYVSFLTSRNLLALVTALIVVVATVNIASTLLFLVAEARHDIAVLRATGTPRRVIAGVLLRAGALVGASGGALGTALGLLLATQINAVIALVGGSFAGGDFYLQEIPVALDALPALAAWLFAFACAIAASTVPAIASARIPPAQIIRQAG